MGCAFVLVLFWLIGPWNWIAEFQQPSIFLVELSLSLKLFTSGILIWNIIYVTNENEYSDMNLLACRLSLQSLPAFQ